MNNFCSFISSLCFSIIFPGLCVGQQSIHHSLPWPQYSTRLHQGCLHNPVGHSLDYLQNLKPGNVALVVNQDSHSNHATFSSEKFIEYNDEEYSTFIFSVSFDTENPCPSDCFELEVRERLSIAFPSGKVNEPWNVSNGPHSLHFIPTHSNKEEHQQFGFLLLNFHNKDAGDKSCFDFILRNVSQGTPSFMMVFQDSIHSQFKATPLAALRKGVDQSYKQPLLIEWIHTGQPTEGILNLQGIDLLKVSIETGPNKHIIDIPATLSKELKKVELRSSSGMHEEIAVPFYPVPPFEVHLLPHSHVDIGFTHLQDEVMHMQWKMFEDAIEMGEQTRNYPEAAQFKWNTEVLWAVEGYLQQADSNKRQSFIQAVHDGIIGLDALFGSVLTGLQKPEELMQNTYYAHELLDHYNIPIASTMITDVPGAQWGFVPALYHNGVRYLNMGPNHMPHMADMGYQVGHTIKTWGDIPFYWESISGKERILVWMSSHGYSWFHPWLLGNIRKKEGIPILAFLNELQEKGYPYHMVQLRYTLGDNAGPDKDLSDFVKEWNETYSSPKLIINTNEKMFQQFEERYGHVLPVVRGDFTPYWEDGAASSALETSLNRNTVEKLLQAELLWSANPNKSYPFGLFREAWRNILLFSEHTWGAYSSKSDPDGEFAKAQWEVKQSFATRAAEITNHLLDSILGHEPDDTIEKFSVVNTHPFSGSGLIKFKANPGIRVKDSKGNSIPSQRLQSGEVAIHIDDIPAFGQMTLTIEQGLAENLNQFPRDFSLTGNNQTLIFNEKGELAFWQNESHDVNMIRKDDEYGFNRFIYSGIDTIDMTKANFVRMDWVDHGPILQSIRMVYECIGVDSIVSMYSLIVPSGVLEINNTVYKKKITCDENARFVFPFEVPDAQIRMDHPFGIMIPGADQMPGSNFNFYCTQRWVDFSNPDFGIAWVSLDAPIMEFAHPHGQQWASDLKKRPWLDSFVYDTRIFSWIMNNVWFVNYKGYQEGNIPFRYRILLHQGYDPVKIMQFALLQHQPLLVRLNEEDAGRLNLPFNWEGDDEIQLSLCKKSRTGDAIIMRLVNMCPDKKKVSIIPLDNFLHIYYTDHTEIPGEKLHIQEVEFDGWEIKTLRLDRY